MHDMTAKKAAVSPVGQHPHFQKYHRRFPTTAWLRRRAPRNVPLFAFEYGDTGAGNDVGIGHNWAAFDAVEIVPRYGVMPSLPPVDVKLFGRSYAAPIGVAPMGGPSLVWPGADLLMAKAAQRARIPYTLSVAGGATIEQAAEVAPDVFWLQLYRFWHDDHKIGFDLVRRGQAAGAKVLALTLDVPVRTTRSRETYAGLAHEFRPNARMIWEMMVRPEMDVRAFAERLSALCHHQRLCARGSEHQRDHRLCACAHGRRVFLGRGQALSRCVEGPNGGQGHPAPQGRRKGCGAWDRWHLGVEPWRPPDRRR